MTRWRSWHSGGVSGRDCARELVGWCREATENAGHMVFPLCCCRAFLMFSPPPLFFPHCFCAIPPGNLFSFRLSRGAAIGREGEERRRESERSGSPRRDSRLLLHTLPRWDPFESRVIMFAHAKRPCYYGPTRHHYPFPSPNAQPGWQVPSVPIYQGFKNASGHMLQGIGIFGDTGRAS